MTGVLIRQKNKVQTKLELINFSLVACIIFRNFQFSVEDKRDLSGYKLLNGDHFSKFHSNLDFFEH